MMGDELAALYNLVKTPNVMVIIFIVVLDRVFRFLLAKNALQSDFDEIEIKRLFKASKGKSKRRDKEKNIRSKEIFESPIVQTPGVLAGRPHIKGTRISVQAIAGWHMQGMSPENIADQYSTPQQNLLPHVYAALAYYHANRNEIEAGIAAE